MQVWARHKGSTATYQDWRSAGPITLVWPGLSLTSLTSTVSLYATVGQPSRWTVTPAGGHMALFKFWLYTEATGSWSVLQDYSTENVLTWTPDTLGRHLIQVWARNTDSSAAYDAWIGSGFFTVTTDTLELRSVTPNVTMPVGVGTPISWTALASGITGPVEYAFWLFEEGAGWSPVQDYSTAATVTWTPARPGRYALQAWARNAGNAATYETWVGTPFFDISVVALEVTAFATNASVPHRTGRSEIWSATAGGGNGTPIEYQFWVYREGSGWTIGQAYSPSSTFVWTPPGAGTVRAAGVGENRRGVRQVDRLEGDTAVQRPALP